MTTDSAASMADQTSRKGACHELWKALELGVEQQAVCRIGRLTIGVYRSTADWWIRCSNEATTADPALELTWQPWSVGDLVPGSFPPVDVGPNCVVRRLLLGDEPITLRPALADRRVIVRPAAAMMVAPRSRVELFVGTPLWVEFVVGDIVLYSQVVHQPSDTWFGTPLEGELAFAARTHGRLQMENLEFAPARAFTRVEVINDLASTFDFERIALPVPELSLFAGEQSAWTESVKLTRLEEGDGQGHARVEISSGPPEQVASENPPTLRGPHVIDNQGSRIRSFGNRALGALFG